MTTDTAAKVPTRPARKVAPKTVAKTPAKAPVKATPRKTKPVAKPVKAKVEKVKKPKMVRDSFSIPKLEYAVFDVLKLRATKLGKPAKKTELLRAGIKTLASLSDAAFLAALKTVPSLKTGRPANKKTKAA
jgi:hypothetical protein